MTTYYEKLEIVGVSTKSYEDAITTAIQEVQNKYADLRWFEVVEFRGGIEDSGKIQYQVVLKVAAKNG